MGRTESSPVLHPDRLLPGEPSARSVARRLLESVRDLPIISPHGHVDAQLFVDDDPFPDPTTLLVTPDHYVTRLLHADGVPLDRLGVGESGLSGKDARAAWRLLCERWTIFAGTPSRLWLETELAEVFGVTARPSAATADAIFDQIAERLADDDYRPRALYQRFGIDVLATTDDPCDDLAAHAALAADPTWSGRVVPTFRPDRYLEPAAPNWNDDVDRLGSAAGVDVDHFAGFLAALEERRRTFIAHGATATDHSHRDVRTDRLPQDEAARIYDAARRGTVTGPDAAALRRHLVGEMVRMACDDGLVMMLHPGVRRNHHHPTFEKFGPDTGHDLPLRVELVDALQPALGRHGTDPRLHLVLFTLDETTWSRELAPLAGFYPSVYIGSPWWFLDAPAAIRRFHDAVTETAGFSRLSGFVDDTRAFCSIPARHDMARRVDASFLAELVASHRIDEAEAASLLRALVVDQPRHVFKL